MLEFAVTFIVGIVCIALGISNMRGNISTLHSYHRNRVSEENRLPFGKRVGLGTVIAGASVCIFSAFSVLAIETSNKAFFAVGGVILGVGLIIGLLISFLAMIKYNGGIF